MATVKKSRKLDVIKALLGQGTIMIGLFSNQFDLTEDSILADFTMLTEPGYLPISLGTITYTDSGGVIDGSTTILRWARIPVPYTVAGYVVYNATDGDWCFADLFGGIVSVVPAGYDIKIIFEPQLQIV